MSADVYKDMNFSERSPENMMEAYDFIRLIEEVNGMRPSQDMAVMEKIGFVECKTRVIKSLLEYLEDFTHDGLRGFQDWE